jgi:hypothetical protein
MNADEGEKMRTSLLGWSDVHRATIILTVHTGSQIGFLEMDFYAINDGSGISSLVALEKKTDISSAPCFLSHSATTQHSPSIPLMSL